VVSEPPFNLRGAGGQAPQSETPLEVIERNYKCTSYTNMYEVTLLFSIRKRKFVKPVLMKHLKVFYKILPGRYIMFESSGRRYINDYTIDIYLVEITKDETEIIKHVELHVARENNDFSVVNNNPIIIDFVNAIPPAYHSYPPVDFNKVYTEEDVNYLLNLLNQEKIIYLYTPEE